MEFCALKEIGKRDIEILKNASEVKNEHVLISTQFLENAEDMVGRINFHLANLLSDSAGKNGLTPLGVGSRVWEIKGAGISLAFRIQDEATLSKMQTTAQVIIKRGKLQNIFNVFVTHERSSDFEFAKQYENFSKQLNGLDIHDVIILKDQIEKMKATPKLICKDFKRTFIDENEFWMSFRGEKMAANSENFETIIKKMFDLSSCLK